MTAGSTGMMIAKGHVKRLSSALAVLLLAGCSSAPSETAAPTPPTVDQTAPARPTCDASGVQYAIGAPFDEANVETLEAQSGANQVRVLRPGSAATMDYRDDRLNIHLESNDMIEALRCG